MSERYIIRYAGAGVAFASGLELVPDHKADRFGSELEAWNEARLQGLNLNRVTVAPFVPEISSRFHNVSANYAGLGEAGQKVITTTSKVSAAPGDGKVRTGHSLPS